VSEEAINAPAATPTTTLWIFIRDPPREPITT
jgi:hypothetical protein